MIDISTALYNILHSRYGRDVRQSIHDGIYQIDANANEALVRAKTMGVGTAISSATSSSTGYTEGNLYLNNSTWDLWKCIGTNSWELQGNIHGLKGDQGIAGTNGTNGTNGKDGVDGTSYYVHVRYSEYYDGSNFTAQPSANSKYVGIYSGTSATAPIQKEAYNWASYVGASGVNSYMHIAYSQYADGTDFVREPMNATKFIGIYTGQLSEPPAGKQYYTWSKYVGESGTGSGDMLKSEFAAQGVSGIVDHALISNTAFGASEGLNSDYLAVAEDNKLKVVKADKATSLQNDDGTTISADTITNKLTHLSETDGTISSDYVKVGTSTLSSEISKKITGYKDAKIKAHSGKLLGTSFTSEQSSKIRSGDFSWCEIGDYWTIGGHNWRIWDIDWYLNKGDTPCSEHHLVIMPDDGLLDANGSSTRYMNDSNTTAGGYAGTKYRSTYKSQCESSVNSSFGSGHILSHREMLCNAVASGKASGSAWYDCSVEIPSEVMMYGSTIWSNYTDGGSAYNVGTAYPQLALAYLDPSRVVNRENYWLRDVASDSSFANVNAYGRADSGTAANPWVGVRPYFLLY